MASPLKLLRESGLIRHNLIVFALLTAVLNGLVTATVGAYLAEAYSNHQLRRESVQGLADLIYERRARAGMVVSSLRRGAELDELRQRKRGYDDVFVEWNKRIQHNMLQIREVLGIKDSESFELVLQGDLVRALREMDACLTQGYDDKIAGKDPIPVVDACRFHELQQFSLDCAKGLTDELYRLTRLSLLPFGGASRREIADSSSRARAACVRVPAAKESPAVPPQPPKPAGGN